MITSITLLIPNNAFYVYEASIVFHLVTSHTWASDLPPPAKSDSLLHYRHWVVFVASGNALTGLAWQCGR